MVSYPESEGGARIPRRPPSVSSRASTSRRHRHHRSGGNEFPIFGQTGDVEIVISCGAREQRYLLHRLILAQCSGFFETGMSDEWSRAQQAGGSNGVQQHMSQARGGPGEQRRRWRYELDWGNKEGDMPMLVQKDASDGLFGGDRTPRPPPVRNKPPPPQSGFFRSMSNFSALNVSQPPQDEADEIFRDYDNFFRIFYNHTPALDPANVANAYVECKALLQLGDMYDALEVVGPRIDHHLLRFQGRLWKQIAKYPPSYLKLGHLARSRAIFAEALVHVVGQWPAGVNQLRGQVPGPVIELIEDKAQDLEELKSKVEGKLFRLTLTTSRGDRVTPANAWMDWMAMSLFRQWLAENTTPPPASILKDSPRRTGDGERTQPAAPATVNTGRVFRLIATGGQAYLGRDELKRFLKINPDLYNRDNLRRFERRVDEIKNLARDAVTPLARNFLELDMGRDGGGLPYLTCTRVDEQDYPWDDE